MSTWNVPTVIDLQGVTPGLNDDAIVAGYRAAGDLGGGVFSWDPLPPASAVVAGTAAADADVSNASNTAPIKVTTLSPHGYVSGQVVLIEGVGGNTNANNTWLITVEDPTSFTLNGSSGNKNYTGGGTAYTTSVTTVAAHELVTNQQAMIAGVHGTTAANGTWRLTVLSATVFSIAARWDAAWTGGGVVGDGGRTIPSMVTRGFWRRIGSGPENVRWYGAVGDGSADDTVSFQGALTTLGRRYDVLPLGLIAGGGTLFVPAGVYRITAPLTVPQGPINSNIVIEGAGQDATVVQASGWSYFPVIQSMWGPGEAVRTFLSVRDLTLASDSPALTGWSASTAYAKGDVITSGLSNRLLLCTAAGTSGEQRPFGQLWNGIISDPAVSISGTPLIPCSQVIITITTGGSFGVAQFEWSTDGQQTVNGPLPIAPAVALGATGLTAHFGSAPYNADSYRYCSPPMGYGFSTVHDTFVTDNSVEWKVIDGGCGILQFDGGELCIERVHFYTGLVVGVILDGTEVSVVRDCTVESANGIWVTGANQRLNNPAIDPDASIDQSNVISVEDCWFDCAQLSFASEGNADVSLLGANFEAGEWYGWTTGMVGLTVANMVSEGGRNGWFVGSLAPFNGNGSYPTTNGTFYNCVIDPNSGTGPAVQASNYAPATSGYLALATPFERLTFRNCYLASHGEAIFVGMGIGNGYRVIDTIWGGGATWFDASSLATLSEYSDGANNATPGGATVGYGCVPEVGLDVNRSFALRATGITVAPEGPDGLVSDLANPLRASVEVTGSGGSPWSLTGVAGGTEGQILELVNLTGQTMTLLHQDPSSAPGNRLICPSADTITLPVSPGGFAWVRMKYSHSQLAWLILDHS